MRAESLPGGEALVAGDALERLEAAGTEGLDAESLLRDLRSRAEEPVVEAALRRLELEGMAALVAGRWYAHRHKGWVLAEVQGSEADGAVVRSTAERESSFFIPRRRLQGAVEGDTVLLRVRPSRRGEPWAAVVKVVHRRHRSLVGTLEVDEDGRRWLAPFDAGNPLEVEVVDAGEVEEESYVRVEVLPRADAPHSRGRVVEVLGHPDAPGVDVRVVLAHYDIPDAFPREVLSQVQGFPADPRPDDLSGREDLRGRTAVTIDGAQARDFDDAVTLETRPGGAFLLGVHIADVSHYVEEGSPLDREAYRRGTSVYYPEGAVPMLPESLSNGLCSLRPGVPRLTLSAFLEIDPEGGVRSRRFAETVIASARRLTYEEVRRLIEEPAPGDAREYGGLPQILARMRALMELLRAARGARGSIDFDLPEGDVILDTDGHTVGIRPGQRTVAHRIIEEFMIAANEAVATELVDRESPALFRVHDPPDRDDLSHLKAVLSSLGIKLRGDLDGLPPGALQDVLARVEGKPEEAFVEAVVLRSMKRAAYSPDCRGHYALASRRYTHFTSPIRRYPDLLVHRALKGLLRRGRRESSPELVRRLPAIAAHTSFTERRAERSERDLLQWKKVRFLAERVGERFSGRITGVQPFGLFVQLDDLHVDGLLPIRELSDDYYLFEPERHRLVGDNHGRAFRLGDDLEVVLAGVSERHRGLDLRPARLREPRRRRRRPKR